jgi:hypothetical protein
VATDPTPTHPAPDGVPVPPSPEAARNIIASRVMLASDNMCNGHKADIVANQSVANTAFGSLTNIFSGLGTFVGGAATKAGLAAGAALSNGSRSLVNEEIYYKAFAVAIVRAINQDREPVGVKIVQRLHDEKVATYPIDDVLRDLQKYHESCSFTNGLRIVAEAVDKRAPTLGELQSRIGELNAQRDQRIKALGLDPKNLSDSDRTAIAGDKVIQTIDTKLSDLTLSLATAGR